MQFFKTIETMIGMTESNDFIKPSFPATSLNVVIKYVEILRSGGQMFVQMDLDIRWKGIIHTF